MVIKALLVNKETICIFFKSYDPKIPIEPQLLGGFLSAIHFLAQDLSRDQIKELVMGKSKILYHLLDEKNDLTMAVITDKDTEDATLKQTIEKIIKSFLNTFTIEDITSHVSDEAYFASFEKIIDALIQPAKGMGNEIIDMRHLFPVEGKPEIDVKTISIPFLLKTIKKGLGRIIYSLFIRRRVIVTGDRAMTKLMVDSLDVFSPNHPLKKIYWAENAGDTLGDIVGVPPQLANLFIDSTIIDLDKEKIIGFKDNKYFDDLVKEIKNMKPEEAFSVISIKINLISGKAKELALLINKVKLSEKDFDNVSKDISSDMLDVIETYLIVNNPQSLNLIKKIATNSERECRKLLKDFKKQNGNCT